MHTLPPMRALDCILANFSGFMTRTSSGTAGSSGVRSVGERTVGTTCADQRRGEWRRVRGSE